MGRARLHGDADILRAAKDLTHHGTLGSPPIAVRKCRGRLGRTRLLRASKADIGTLLDG